MINLMYAGNDNTFNGILISLLSIIKHHKGPLNVIILSMDLTELKPSYKIFSKHHRDIIEKELRKVNEASCVNIVDVKLQYQDSLLNSKNEESCYTPYAMIRLLADRVEGIPDKVLYLDYDTCAYNDIEELWNIDISDYEFAGAKDYYGRFFINRNYLNSGVLLMNMVEIRKTGLFGKCLKMMKEKKMFLPDQSALNKMAERKLIIDFKYNEQHKIKPDTIIRHFSATVRFLPYVH